MDLIDILAIFGSLAWLPYIIQIISSYFKKAKLTITADNYLQVGFTTNGPILNFSLAFLSEKKMSLINRIDIELTHESKETQHFTWKWFEEILLEMDMPAGGTIPYKKHQTAIAILVNENSLSEKKIGFQKEEFHIHNNKLTHDVEEDYNNLKKSGQELSKIEAAQSYNKLIDHYKNSFNWKIGNYTAKIIVYLSENHSFTKTVHFDLNNLEIRTLERNLEICIKLFSRLFNPVTDAELKFEWINTSLS
ncbi:MAG: hypothetical protein WCZ90_18925 [Melioribacteraceae bacterium]